MKKEHCWIQVSDFYKVDLEFYLFTRSSLLLLLPELVERKDGTPVFGSPKSHPPAKDAFEVFCVLAHWQLGCSKGAAVVITLFVLLRKQPVWKGFISTGFSKVSRGRKMISTYSGRIKIKTEPAYVLVRQKLIESCEPRVGKVST